MNVIKIRIVTAAILSVLTLILFISIQPKRNPHVSSTPPVQISAVKKTEPTSTYQDPKAVLFDFGGKVIGEISPFDIDRFAHTHPSDYISFKNLWQALGIDLEDWRLYEHCQVRNFRVSLDNNPDLEILQRLYDKWSSWSAGGIRYLLWKRLGGKRGTKWKLLGHLDFGGQRYTEPGHQVFHIRGKHFLLIDYMTVHGSGLGANDKAWYEVRPNGLQEVLRYPSWCFSMGGTETETRTRLRWGAVSSGKMRIQIEFTDRYTLRGEEDKVIKRWHKRRRVAFIWSKQADRFLFDRRRSSISKKDFEATCNF
ncbi:MAG: hypothetical protein JNM09_23175 [Blastocatellia bacterium]|nr:hypothetical protein [Blastocatellia bacterium]